ncbi:GSCOCG00009483001-RA-CDS [Cotesia congregata]|nr:GSCOCG00009483001-RA-CDS [Cotesia congregata]
MTRIASFDNFIILFSIISFFTLCLTAPKFFKVADTNFLCSFQSSPSAQINP